MAGGSDALQSHLNGHAGPRRVLAASVNVLTIVLVVISIKETAVSCKQLQLIAVLYTWKKV